MRRTTYAQRTRGNRARSAVGGFLAGIACGIAACALARRYGNGRQSALHAIRGFNKTRLNPAVLRFAGRRWSPYGVVEHFGRQTGRQHQTPVVVGQLEDEFIIPLPFGLEVDWFRNVRATGECVIAWRGEKHAAMEPEVIEADEALRAFPPLMRFTFRLFGITHFLKVHCLLDRPVEQIPVLTGAIG